MLDCFGLIYYIDPVKSHTALSRCFCIVLLVTALGAAACSDPEDTKAPTIVSVSPQPEATGVDVTLKPSATFSEDLDLQSIQDGLIEMTDLESDTRLSGHVLGTSRTLVFAPSAPLVVGHSYRVRVVTDADCNVAPMDVNGNCLEQPYEWTFTAQVGNWSAHRNVVTHSSSQAAIEAPRFAIDVATGNAMALWSEGSGRRLISRLETSVGEARPAATVRTPPGTARLYLEAAPAFLSDGSALAAWRETEGALSRVRASRYDVATDQWSDPVYVDAGIPATSYALVLGVYADQQGSAWVVFTLDGGGLYAARYEVASNSWGSATLLGASPVTSYAHAAISPHGAFAVTWQVTGGAYTSRVWTSTSGWSAASNPFFARATGAESYTSDRASMAWSGDSLLLAGQFVSSAQASLGFEVARYSLSRGAWEVSKSVGLANTDVAMAIRIASGAADSAVLAWSVAGSPQFATIRMRSDMQGDWSISPLDNLARGMGLPSGAWLLVGGLAVDSRGYVTASIVRSAGTGGLTGGGAVRFKAFGASGDDEYRYTWFDGQVTDFISVGLGLHELPRAFFSAVNSQSSTERYRLLVSDYGAFP